MNEQKFGTIETEWLKTFEKQVKIENVWEKGGAEESFVLLLGVKQGVTVRGGLGLRAAAAAGG